MTEKYELGKVYGWNGGECPIPPRAKVKIWCEEDGCYEGKAKEFVWHHLADGYRGPLYKTKDLDGWWSGGNLVAFRVLAF
jgi:hypothetical protein